MLMKIGIVAGYIILSILVAWFGSRRKWGFWGYLWGSVLFTPFIGFLLILASDPRREDYPVPANRESAFRGDQI